jgi:hypothetical protein
LLVLDLRACVAPVGELRVDTTPISVVGFRGSVGEKLTQTWSRGSSLHLWKLVPKGRIWVPYKMGARGVC